MNDELIYLSIRVLKDRHIDGVGFVNKPNGRYRPDAACWAILALQASRKNEAKLITKARRQLAAVQANDGRICVSPEHPDAYWPTPLAILAWHGSPEFEKERLKAVKFLLGFSEIKINNPPNKIIAHDGTIKGWPWIAKTSCWVEPTALALIALRTAQQQSHRRVRDAVRLLIDRQLPHGGWNYGNTFVFQQQLRPIPITTGIALQALHGLVDRQEVSKSILYLQSQLKDMRSPFTLGWSLLGLNAWSEVPVKTDKLGFNLPKRYEEYDHYDTTSLGLMILSCFCKNGLIAFLQQLIETDEK